MVESRNEGRWHTSLRTFCVVVLSNVYSYETLGQKKFLERFSLMMAGKRTRKLNVALAID